MALKAETRAKLKTVSTATLFDYLPGDALLPERIFRDAE